MASITQKNELAWQTYLQTITELSAANIYTGISSFEKEGPAIIISADKGPEDPLNSGNYRVHLNVSTKWTAAPDDSEREQFEALSELVYNAMKAADIVAVSALVDDFAILGFTDKGPSESVNAGAWVDGHDFESYSCPSDIAD